MYYIHYNWGVPLELKCKNRYFTIILQFWILLCCAFVFQQNGWTFVKLHNALSIFYRFHLKFLFVVAVENQFYILKNQFLPFSWLGITYCFSKKRLFLVFIFSILAQTNIKRIRSNDILMPGFRNSPLDGWITGLK